MSVSESKLKPIIRYCPNTLQLLCRRRSYCFAPVRLTKRYNGQPHSKKYGVSCQYHGQYQTETFCLLISEQPTPKLTPPKLWTKYKSLWTMHKHMILSLLLFSVNYTPIRTKCTSRPSLLQHITSWQFTQRHSPREYLNFMWNWYCPNRLNKKIEERH